MAISGLDKVAASSSGAGTEEEDNLPRNYTHDYARLEKINNVKRTLNILKDDRNLIWWWYSCLKVSSEL